MVKVRQALYTFLLCLYNFWLCFKIAKGEGEELRNKKMLTSNTEILPRSTNDIWIHIRSTWTKKLVTMSLAA